MSLRRDFRPHPLVLLKLAICKLGLAGVFGLIEFCHRCGRRVNLVWWADSALWNEITGMGDGGVRCVRCFDRECFARGKFVQWVPKVIHVKTPEGEWVTPGREQEPARC